MNGKLACTEKLQSSSQQAAFLKQLEAIRQQRLQEEEAKDKGKNKGKKKDKSLADEKKEERPPPPEHLIIDPLGFAVLPLAFALAKPPDEGAKKEGAKKGAKNDGGSTSDQPPETETAPAERVRIKYLKVDTSLGWDANRVMQEVRRLRGRDEEAELAHESHVSVAKHLTLANMYGKNAPPIWRHPTFASECADAFICGTSLETGTLDATLSLMAMAVKDLLEHSSLAASLLHPKHRSALSVVHTCLEDALELARALNEEQRSPWTEAYRLKVVRELNSLAPGAGLMIPCCAAKTLPFFISVSRYPAPYEARCDLAIITCDDALLAHHRASSDASRQDQIRDDARDHGRIVCQALRRGHVGDAQVCGHGWPRDSG